jgi:sulfatase modifying factor 1
MSAHIRVSRRGFLAATGALAAAASLGACKSKVTQTLTVVLEVTSTRPPSTSTPTPNPSTKTPEKRKVPMPEMVLVEPGTFSMGSDEGLPNETPVHEVTISKPFLIGIYPVINAEYSRLCAETKKCSVPDDAYPVVGVNWFEAVEYCNWLSNAAGFPACYSGKGNFIKCDFSAGGFRLPTEVEWEFAARGGKLSEGYLYAGSNDPDLVAWYKSNSGGELHPVGEKLPNELGIYDMSGNSWEWCWDWFDEGYYLESPDFDPTGPTRALDSQMPSKSRRSGGFNEEAAVIRTTFRSADWISYAGGNGFRLVRTVV